MNRTAKILYLAFLAAILPARAVGAADIKANGKLEWEKLVQAANEEGQLSIYAGDYENFIAEFPKAYPKIKVSLVLDARQYSTRIISERRAGKYLADVIMVGTSGPLGILAKSLDPLKPVLTHPEVVDESKWFRGRHAWADKEQQYVFNFVGDVASSVAINTNLVKPREIKSYWDILKPGWKGKIMARNIMRPGPGAGSARMVYHHPELGPKFLTTLYRDMDAYVSDDARAMADYLAKGRYAFFFFTGGAEIAAMKAIGLPVDNRIDGIKEGGFLSTQFGTLALMNRAPHPMAAKLFINWALSRQGQILFQNLASTPNDPINSLRMDIPKDHLAPHQRLKPDGKYFTSYDSAPVQELARDALAAGRR